MIDWLEIHHFAVADHIELELASGFTAITGETGSGKSIMVDAMALLLGHRSDATFIQHRRDSAELQAGFTLDAGHPARQWLQEQEMAADDELIIRRILRRDKPNKGYINGMAATATQLRELGQYLVEIHGQNEHHSLTRKRQQLVLLDELAGNAQRLARLNTCYDRIRDLQSQLDAVLNADEASEQRTQLLRFQLQELAELAPVVGEWEEIEARHRRLNHSQEIATGAEEIAAMLQESPEHSVNRYLSRAIAQLQQLEKFAASLQSIRTMLEEARVVVDEANAQLTPYYRDHAVDEQQLWELEQRFSKYHTLARKHRLQPPELAQHYAAIEAELGRLASPQEEIKRLQQAVEEETGQYQQLAQTIGKARKKHAARVAQEVTQLMQELGMAGGQFDAALQPADQASITRYGRESVEFRVSTNPGVPPKPVARVASGGELSRISLAIQVVLASTTRTSLIFDEVDTGIGGAVAHVVGEKLRALGDRAQVICVTHLPQIAAQARHQISVSRQAGKIRVATLNKDQRIAEIARMSGGGKITQQARAHAQALLQAG